MRKKAKPNTEDVELKIRLDKTIGSICTHIEIEGNHFLEEEYADNIRALASLVEARTLLNKA